MFQNSHQGRTPRGPTRFVSVLAGLLAFATSGWAYQHLEPGPQSLQGVIVRELQVLDRPSASYGLFLAPGTDAQMLVSLRVRPGDRATAKWIAATAVDRRLTAELQYQDSYQEVPRHQLRGVVSGDSDQGFTLLVQEVPDNPSEDGTREQLARWRKLILEIENSTDRKQAAAAMKALEKLGVLKAMARATLPHAP